MNKTQKGLSAKVSKETSAGFGLIESLLIILILAVIGFGCYYVWHNKHQTDKTLGNTAKVNQTAQPPKNSSNASKSQSQSPANEVSLTLSLDAGKSLSFKAPAGWEKVPNFENKVQRTINGQLYVLSAQLNDQDYLKLDSYQSSFNAIVGSAKTAKGTQVSVIKLDPNNGPKGELALSSCEPDQSGFGCSLSLDGSSLLIMISGAATGQAPVGISFSGSNFDQFINELQQAIRTMPV